MIEFDFSIEVNPIAFESNLLFDIYMDEVFLTTLNSDKSRFKKSFCLYNNKHCITIYRRYKNEKKTESNSIIKNILSYFSLFAVLSLSTIQTFDIPVESKDELSIVFTDNNPQISVSCTQKENNFVPLFVVKNFGCDIVSTKITTISEEELKNIYLERKSFIMFSALLWISLCVAVLSLGLAHKNITTIIFSLIICALFLLCSVFSFRSLKKKYQEEMSKAKRQGDGLLDTRY